MISNIATSHTLSLKEMWEHAEIRFVNLPFSPIGTFQHPLSTTHWRPCWKSMKTMVVVLASVTLRVDKTDNKPTASRNPTVIQNICTYICICVYYSMSKLKETSWQTDDHLCRIPPSRAAAGARHSATGCTAINCCARYPPYCAYHCSIFITIIIATNNFIMETFWL